MLFGLALVSAFGVALANGIAAVLEKTSADKQSKQKSLKVGFLWKLFADWPYLIGLFLDIIAWILTLVAVHTLPLFIVQPIVAFSVVVTALIDKLILHRNIGRTASFAILIILAGVSMLAVTASPEKALPVSSAVKWSIVAAPLLLAALGSLFARSTKTLPTAALAAVGGTAFGGTAVAGRMLVVIHPYWHILANPLLWALAAYGLTGILCFTVALQRHHASVINSAMVSFETLVPVFVGIAFLGDRPGRGQWWLVAAGIALAFAGTLIVSLKAESEVPGG